MSRLFANKRELVISKFEIFAILIATALILWSLNPKKSLQKAVLNETSNYDLTAKYLQNLIRINPNDSELILSMAKTLYQQQRFDLAGKILNKLIKNAKHDIKEDAAITYLDMNNYRLKKTKSLKKREELIATNRKILKEIEVDGKGDIEKLKTLYYTALSIGDKDSALKFSSNIATISKGRERVKWLKATHYLSDKLKKTDIDRATLFMLVKYDDSKLKKDWIDLSSKYIKKGADIESLAKKLNLRDEDLAYFYLMNDKIDKSFDIYRDIFEKEDSQDRKREIFLKIIKSLQASNKIKNAALFAHKYEDLYIDDENLTTKLLKIYLQANRADFAKVLSLKILKRRGI